MEQQPGMQIVSRTFSQSEDSCLTGAVYPAVLILYDSDYIKHIKFAF